jgi:hypothetical protein
VNLKTWLRAEWDRIAGFGLILLGVVLLFLGYQGVQETAFLAEQLAYIASGGLGGLFSLGLGVGLLLSADLHDEWYKLDRIEAAIRGEPLPDSTTVLDLMGDNATGTHPVPSREASRQMLNASVPVDPGRSGPAGVTGTPLALAMDWRATHRVKAVGLLALVLLLPLTLSTAGWRRASTTADLDVATEGLAMAIAGTVIALALITGYNLWLRIRVVRREGAVFRGYLLERGLAKVRQADGAPAGEIGLRDGTADGRVVVAAGLGRFHRAACPVLAGLDTSTVERAQVDAGLSGCGICGAE